MAAAAIRAGAKEFIPLLPEAELLIAAVLAAVSDDDRPLVARDPIMQTVLKLADQVAGSDASILITGESGVGKEVMARYVHKASRRSERPFISVNCAAIPENLLESELFGHEKGSSHRRAGPADRASSRRPTACTLLLGRNLRDGRPQASWPSCCAPCRNARIDRVGGSKPVQGGHPHPGHFQLARPRPGRASEGTFREDLPYRLNVVNLRLAAAARAPGRRGGARRAISPGKYAAAQRIAHVAAAVRLRARRRVVQHRWPGNVRVVENAMHRAVLLSVGPEIEAAAIRLPDGAPLAGDAGSVAASRAVQAASYGQRHGGPRLRRPHASPRSSNC